MDPLLPAQSSQTGLSSTCELGEEASEQGTVQQEEPVMSPADSAGDNPENASVAIRDNTEAEKMEVTRPAGIVVESHGMEELLNRFGGGKSNANKAPPIVWPELLTRLPTSEDDGGPLNHHDLWVALGSRVPGSTCGEAVERISLVLGLPLVDDSLRGVHLALEASYQLPSYKSSANSEADWRANTSLFLACIRQYGLLHEEMVRLATTYPNGLSNEEILKEITKMLPNRPIRQLKKVISGLVTDENGRISSDGFCELVLREKANSSSKGVVSGQGAVIASNSKGGSQTVPAPVAEQNDSAAPSMAATGSVSLAGERKAGEAQDVVSVAEESKQDGRVDPVAEVNPVEMPSTAGNGLSEGAERERPTGGEMAAAVNDPKAGAGIQSVQATQEPQPGRDQINADTLQAQQSASNQAPEGVPRGGMEAAPMQQLKPLTSGKAGQSTSTAATQKKQQPAGAKKVGTAGEGSANGNKAKVPLPKSGVPRYAQPTAASARPAEPSAPAIGASGQPRAPAARQRAGSARTIKASRIEGQGRIPTSTLPVAATTRRSKPVDIDWARLDQQLCYQKSGEASARRAKLWTSLDSSQRSYLPMAAMEVPLRDVLGLPATFDLKQALVCAVHAAKAAVPVKGQHGPASVERAEFRLFLLYLHQYMDYAQAWHHVGPQPARKLSMAEMESEKAVLEKWLGPWDGFGNDLVALAASHDDGIPWGVFITWALARPPLVAVE